MHDNNMDEFLRQVCGKVRFKAAHHDIRAELEDHYETCREDLLAEGLSEAEASAQALIRLGNPAEIGEALNQVHKPQRNMVLLTATVALVVLGVGLMFAISAESGTYLSPYRFLMNAVIGFVGLIAVYHLDYRKVQPYYLWSYGLAIALLIATELFGLQVNGAKNWLSLGGIFTINTFSVAVPLFLFALAGMINKEKNGGFFGLAKIGLTGLIAFILLARIDLKGAFMIGFVYLAVILFACLRGHFGVNKWRYALVALGSCSVGGAAFVVWLMRVNMYYWERVVSMLNPLAYAKTGGWQFYMVQQVIDHVGWIGKADMSSIAEGAYQSVTQVVPEAFTDYALINIIGSFGLLAGVVIIALFAVLFVQGYRTLAKMHNPFGAYLTMGGLTWLAVQSIWHIGANSAIVPFTTSTGLPFVSYGGTGMVVNCLMMGFILSIWRLNRLSETTVDGQRNARRIYMEQGRLVIDLKKERL